MTTEEKALITATVPILKEHGVALTSHFYQRMFRHNPELKNVFNMGNQQAGKQQQSLAMAVLAYAEHIEDPSVLIEAVKRIAHKHVSLEIRPEHYHIVGNHLLASIQEILKEGATKQLIDAWGKAYAQLADILISVEAELYDGAIHKPGGWTGWRPFILKNRIKETEEITSFYLYPADGGKVSKHIPGQYISVRLYVPELSLFQPRQYSISSAPNEEFYRISVKKETAIQERPEGLVSNLLHETLEIGSILEVTSPEGNFTLTPYETPVVFISGGVGQTPLLSMLEHLISTESKRSITWIHGCRDCNVHAFKEVTDGYALNKKDLKKIYFYEVGNSLTAAEKDFHEGIVEIKHILKETVKPEADYYICGPTPFLKKQTKDLLAAGVPRAKIHFEEFGPGILTI